MALLTCPDCRQEVSEQNSHCPHCGCPLHNGKAQSPARRITGKLIGSLGSLLVAAMVLYFLLGADLVRTWLRLRAPSCIYEDVKSTVVEVVKTQLLTDILSGEAISKTVFSLKFVRTMAFDEKTGNYTCAADLSMANADGLNLETPIVYYTQLGEQRGEFITSVQFEEPEEVWMLSPEYQRQQELEALRQQEHEKREQALRDLEDLNRVLELFN